MAGRFLNLRRVPLKSLTVALDVASSDAVRIEPVGFRSVINFRGRPDDDFTTAIKSALDLELPLEPNRWAGDERRTAIWLGPDEWLIVGPAAEAATIEQALRATCFEDQWTSVVDVSHSYTTLLLSGPRTRDLLAKGCPLDLHRRAFGAGQCAQSILAKARVLLRVLDDGQAIELWTRNSFAHYAALWLLDASVEFRNVRPGLSSADS